MLSKQIIRAFIAFIVIILVGVIMLPETEGFKKKKKHKDPVGHKINRWFRNLVKPRVISKTTNTTTNATTNAVIIAGSIECSNNYDPVSDRCVDTCPHGTSADQNKICRVNASAPAPASAPASV
jgi:hypothetical protein